MPKILVMMNMYQAVSMYKVLCQHSRNNGGELDMDSFFKDLWVP